MQLPRVGNPGYMLIGEYELRNNRLHKLIHFI